ncbi:MFS general substrate transporter [Saccharata proteae CBS 121410]|uniref:MFS general substrate transporter n=1 Tax=Saccharata proteae CBS 121410 TaxID=1314787 RepID=A0A9P4LZ86_9PEZI|nr:MFS general substrate transporter [Saccharata proteae CBS 121410]
MASRTNGPTEGPRCPIPGSVHLVDLDGTMHAKHAAGGQHDIVLVPAPSTDPDDPLNWPPRRKALSTACMGVYTLMVGIASAAIYSVLEPIADDTGLTLADLNAGTGYMFLFFGWGCLVWQPLALQYGKRPVYLFSILATMAIQIWAPYTKSNGQWIANKILQGFFGAPIESLCEISITDIYFTHERGTYIGLYALLLAGSNFLAPIFAGFINDGQGWRWVLYWCAIFCAIGFVFLFFFMEETNYIRHTPGTPLDSPGTETPIEVRGDSSPKDGGEKAALSSSALESGSVVATGLLGPSRKTYWDKLKLWQKADLEKSNEIPGMMLRPLIFLSFPVIFYAGFSYGSNLVWFNVLNGTASLILGGTYGFSSSMVGLAYVSPLIGVILASFYTGVIGDRFALWMARRNAGVMESEHRLWLFAPSLLLIPGGLILWGVGAAQHVQWFGCVFAAGVLAATNAIGIQLSVSYAIDSYRALSGEAMVTVILVRNTMSFAIGYGITPWVDNMGLQNAFITAAFAGLAQCLTFLIFVKWGKQMREKSVPRYAKYVEEMAKSGMIH